jgi:hypothetical protein
VGSGGQYSSPCRHIVPRLWAAGVLVPDCWHRLLRTQYSGTAAGMLEPSLQVAGVLGPVFQAWSLEGSTVVLQHGKPILWVAGAQGSTYKCRVPVAMAAVAGTGEPSLQASEVLGLDCPHGLPGV